MKCFIFQLFLCNERLFFFLISCILDRGRNWYVIFRVIAVLFNQNQSLNFLWQIPSEGANWCPVEMRKAEKGKIGYWEDSLGMEQNNLSLREMRALETKPGSTVASSIFSYFEVF